MCAWVSVCVHFSVLIRETIKLESQRSVEMPFSMSHFDPSTLKELCFHTFTTPKIFHIHVSDREKVNHLPKIRARSNLRHNTIIRASFFDHSKKIANLLNALRICISWCQIPLVSICFLRIGGVSLSFANISLCSLFCTENGYYSSVEMSFGIPYRIGVQLSCYPANVCSDIESSKPCEKLLIRNSLLWNRSNIDNWWKMFNLL